MNTSEIAALVLLLSGTFFLSVGSLGVVRLPDFFSRLHAVSKSDTLGAILSLGGLAVYEGWQLTSLKLLLIPPVIAIVNSTAAHALARAAIRSGVQPWVKGQPRN